MKMPVRSLLLSAILAVLASGDERDINIWHSERQRVGHLGDAQDDINIMGRIEAWRDLDALSYRINNTNWVPLSFRAYRRLAQDGDFNVDVPVGQLRAGENTVVITAKYRDGSTRDRAITIQKESGASPLPFRIEWSKVKDPQAVGQYVDGEWRLEAGGLRTARVGYDRVFLIGERTWKDYEVRATLTVHAHEAAPAPGPISGGAGFGVIFRFAGHVDGGPRHFPSGQPKWGYQPFGAICFLRWKLNSSESPQMVYYSGDSGKSENYGPLDYAPGRSFALRMRCETLPDTPAGEGVTRYDFKIWKSEEPEPSVWSWQHTQTSRHALRTGGLALLAHHTDVTFGDVLVTALGGPTATRP